MLSENSSLHGEVECFQFKLEVLSKKRADNKIKRADTRVDLIWMVPDELSNANPN